MSGCASATSPPPTAPAAIRSVEPHRLVCWGRKWYLVGWDTERGDLAHVPGGPDRAAHAPGWSPRFMPRELPEGGDVAAYVARGVSSAGFRFQARVTVHAPAAVVSARINPAVGIVEAIDDHSCLLTTGADSVKTVAVYLGLLDADFIVSEPAGTGRAAAEAGRPLPPRMRRSRDVTRRASSPRGAEAQDRGDPLPSSGT